MDPQTIGVVIAAVCALVAALYTARSSNRSNQESAIVTEAASQRTFQLAFLKTLQDEISRLGLQRDDLRTQLAQTQNLLDGERSKRRALEVQLDELTATVERLQSILHLIPAVLENTDIQRFLNTDYTPE